MKELKRIYYFGEVRDYSDRWLLCLLKKYFDVICLNPNSKKFPSGSCNLIINRLYGSIVNRYGRRKTFRLLEKIKKLEERKIPSVNSSRGYMLYLNRIDQYRFFVKHRIPFVETVPAFQVLSGKKGIQFPCVLKSNSLSRNKRLTIIESKDALANPLNTFKDDLVLQNLIRKNICYRTEFIGGHCLTFIQGLAFKTFSLSFKYEKKLVSTPLKLSFRSKLSKLMTRIGVQVFSIEYFMRGKRPTIVDFNMTSNYPYFFVRLARRQFAETWLSLINHEII